MEIITYFYYATWLVVWLTLFYEAAARTNMRQLLRFGIPLFRHKIKMVSCPDLPDHITGLTEKLNPQTAVQTGWNGLQRILVPANNDPTFLVLPTSVEALEFRNGTMCRGRILLDRSKMEITVTGFFTWPSLVIPILIFLVSTFIPFGFLLIYLLLGTNIYTLRKQYQFVKAVVNSEFAGDKPAELISEDGIL